MTGIDTTPTTQVFAALITAALYVMTYFPLSGS